MTTSCATCGMPLEKKEDMGAVIGNNSFCKYCVNTDGTVKNGEQVFNGGVEFFMGAVPGASRDLAERLTRRNMRSLPYWKERKEKCLEGSGATDEEYVKAMKSLG